MIHYHHILIGPAGAGKTAQGRALAGLLNRPYTDMSRVLKIASKFRPDISNTVAHYAANGALVPDEITMPLFDSYLGTFQTGTSLIFMGVPRTAAQVEPFIASIETHLGFTQLVVGDMELEFGLAFERCQKRAEADRRRGISPREEDTNVGIIRGRLEMWKAEKAGLLKALDGYAKVVPIECHEDPQQTFLGIVEGFNLADQLFIKPAPLVAAA